jgi:hypothetical protein
MNAETVNLRGSQGLIDIRGRELGCALYVEGRPIAMNWCDGCGSIGQYLIRRYASNADRKLACLEKVLNGGRLFSSLSLSAQLESLLELLAPGEYTLVLLRDAEDFSLIQYNTGWRFDVSRDAFYPYGRNLAATQPADTLNRTRIDYYKDQIRSGVCPVAVSITVEDGLVDYIIDGHHKLAAYKALDIPPTFLRIARVNAPELPVTTIDDFSATHPLAKHYREQVRG